MWAENGYEATHSPTNPVFSGKKSQFHLAKQILRGMKINTEDKEHKLYSP